MNRVLIVTLIPLMLGATSYAWWVEFTHEPKSESYNGHPASYYHSNFTHIEMYSCENNSIFSIEQCSDITTNQVYFQTLRDLNNDGVKELWSVGIAKNKEGKHRYSNILIASDPKTSEIIQVLTVETTGPGFAVLSGKDNTLSLFFCMECGNYADVIWVDGKWELKWPEPYGLSPNKSKHTDLVKLSPFLFQKSRQLHQAGV